jgi:hypothetical protein
MELLAIPLSVTEDHGSNSRHKTGFGDQSFFVILCNLFNDAGSSPDEVDFFN